MALGSSSLYSFPTVIGWSSGSSSRLGIKFLASIAAGPHPFPSRTRQLSPPAPMIVGPQGPPKVGRRRIISRRARRKHGGLFLHAAKGWAVRMRFLQSFTARALLVAALTVSYAATATAGAGAQTAASSSGGQGTTEVVSMDLLQAEKMSESGKPKE